METFIRRCQSCGHSQKAKEPDRNKELSSSYRNSKCRKCGSESLDYGSVQKINDDGTVPQKYFND